MKTEKKNEDNNYSIKNDSGEIALISTSIGSNGEFNFSVNIINSDLYHANSKEVNDEIGKLLETTTEQAKLYISNIN